MTAWHQIEVDELPDIKDRKAYGYYKLPDGQIWYPNNIGDGGRATHWVKEEDYWNNLEASFETEDKNSANL